MTRAVASRPYLAAAAVALAALGAAPSPSPAAGDAGGSVALATAAPSAAVPRLAIRHRTLANGLDVYSLEDHASPTVAIQVWYRVGSKDDPPGRSGFAHLFEHLMFKRTRNMPSEMMDRLTEDVGGYNNADTNADSTNYYEVVPSRYLETLLWAEADRLATLQVDEGNFRSERDVVKEEFRQRVDASPYGTLFFTFLPESSFLVHPYRRPGIGSIADLDAADLMLQLLGQLAAAAPDQKELVPRKSALSGSFGRQLETTTGLVDRIGGLLLQGLDPASLERFLPDVEAVGGEAVRALAAEQLRPADMHLVVAGDSTVFLDALRRRFPELRVMPASELTGSGGQPPASGR